MTAAKLWTPRSPQDLRIVAHALEGKPPAQIEKIVGVSRRTIYAVLENARSNGFAIPNFQGLAPQPTDTRKRVRACRAGLDSKPAPEPRPPEKKAAWSDDDDHQLADLINRGVPLTSVASILRHPYRDIIRAAERLGLTRTKTMET